ncbi:MAG TPA: MFS transporter [Stellaceae bacterium]|nr:MFS transporter [Stellaceae bacterium]
MSRRLFRNLWTADFISNLGFFAQSVGAGWLMTSLTRDARLISLVQTASSLPLFLAAIPAGVFADFVDRCALIRLVNIVLVVLTAALALLTWGHGATPVVLLIATFVIGLAGAIAEPAWAALIAEVVSKRDLPSAVALIGVDFNLSRVVSPPLAGLLIAVGGPAAAFAATAASFIPTVLVMPSGLPVTRPPWNAFLEGIRRTIGLAWTSRPVRSVLLLTAAFSVCSSVLFSLLPLYARTQLHADPTQFGILFGAIGAGSVMVAQALDQLRRRFGVANLIAGGTFLLGLCFIAFGVGKSLPVGYVILFVAGFGWFAVLSTLNTAIQFAVSSEHRAAGFSVYIVTAQGVLAFGSAMWGAFAARFGSAESFVVAGVLFVVLGIATRCAPLPWDASAV